MMQGLRLKILHLAPLLTTIQHSRVQRPVPVQSSFPHAAAARVGVAVKLSVSEVARIAVVSAPIIERLLVFLLISCSFRFFISLQILECGSLLSII